MTDNRDTALGDEEEFDRFARSAADGLKRTPPPGGAASIVRAGDRRRTRQRMALAAGGAAILILGVVAAVNIGKDDPPEVQAAPSTSTPSSSVTAPGTSASTASTSPASTVAATGTSTTSGDSDASETPALVTLDAMPEPSSIGDAADLSIDVPYAPTFGLADDDSLWVLDSASGALERHARSDGSLVASLTGVVPTGSVAVARPVSAFGSIWITSPGTVYRVDPDTMTTVAAIDIPGSTIEIGSAWISDIAADSRGVWALSHVPGDVAAVRVDPATNQLAERISVGENGRSIAIGAGSLWVTHVIGTPPSVQFRLTRHDLTTGEEVTSIELPFEAGVVVTDGDDVWLNGMTWVDGQMGQWVVARIAAESNQISTITEIFPSAGLHFGLIFTDLAVAGGDAWMPTPTGLVRVDGPTGDVVARYDSVTGGGVISSPDEMWATDNATRKLFRIPL